MSTILVVEDDPAVRRFLRTVLSGHGHRVLEAGSLAEARARLAEQRPDAVLLDLGLPDGDGLGLVTEVPEEDRGPVIVLSARGHEGDKVIALDAGADDYLTKPFGAGELLARLRAVMRRRPRPDEAGVLVAGPIQIDQARHEVTVEGSGVHLTPIEFKLLVELARQPGKVVTHRQLLQRVWGAAAVEQSHYLRVHVAALRRKLERDPAQPRWLLTEAGIGYRLRDEP